MAAKEDTTTTNDPDFDARHAKDLGAKRFIETKAAETFIPLGAMGAGAAVGYHTLGKAIREWFPTAFKVVDHGADFAVHFKNFTKEDLKAAANTIKGKVSVDVLEKATKANSKLDLETVGGIRELLSHVGEAEVIAIKNSMNVASHNHGKTMSQWAGAAALGLVGSIIGGTFVGYGKWRKEESTRLAANEIDRDISRLEVFTKRDPELVQENQRLREMLAAKEKESSTRGAARPTVLKDDAAELKDDKPSLSVSNAGHEGRLEESLGKERA